MLLLQASTSKILLLEQRTHDKGSCSVLDKQWPVYVAGNKEEREEGEYEPDSKPPSGSPYEAAQKNRRFQIYVHSKLMIVDDEVWDLPGHRKVTQGALYGAGKRDRCICANAPLASQFTLEPQLQCITQPSCAGFTTADRTQQQNWKILQSGQPFFSSSYSLTCSLRPIAHHTSVHYLTTLLSITVTQSQPPSAPQLPTYLQPLNLPAAPLQPPLQSPLPQLTLILCIRC